MTKRVLRGLYLLALDYEGKMRRPLHSRDVQAIEDAISWTHRTCEAYTLANGVDVRESLQ